MRSCRLSSIRPTSTTDRRRPIPEHRRALALRSKTNFPHGLGGTMRVHSPAELLFVRREARRHAPCRCSAICFRTSHQLILSPYKKETKARLTLTEIRSFRLRGATMRDIAKSLNQGAYHTGLGTLWRLEGGSRDDRTLNSDVMCPVGQRNARKGLAPHRPAS